MKQVSIGRQAALEMAATHWWEGKTPREIAEVQMFLVELACPFSVFHHALTESLGRPVYTHELGLDYEGLCKELMGERKSPSFDQIVALIPEEKRILITLPEVQ